MQALPIDCSWLAGKLAADCLTSWLGLEGGTSRKALEIYRKSVFLFKNWKSSALFLDLVLLWDCRVGLGQRAEPCTEGSEVAGNTSVVESLERNERYCRADGAKNFLSTGTRNASLPNLRFKNLLTSTQFVFFLRSLDFLPNCSLI